MFAQTEIAHDRNISHFLSDALNYTCLTYNNRIEIKIYIHIHTRNRCLNFFSFFISKINVHIPVKFSLRFKKSNEFLTRLRVLASKKAEKDAGIV